MKLQLRLGLIGAIGLTTALASVITLTSNPVHAEQPDSSEPTILPKKPALGTSTEQFPEFLGIELTPQQQEKIKTIRQELQAEFEVILSPPELTPEQQTQLNSGQPIQMAFPTPTPEQTEKLQQVIQDYRQKVEAVLTPAQQEQFRQNQNKDTVILLRIRGN